MRCARARSEAVQIMLVFDNKPFPKGDNLFFITASPVGGWSLYLIFFKF